jgi:hypothetical protein
VITHRRRRREGKWESPRDFHLFLTGKLSHDKLGRGSVPPKQCELVGHGNDDCIPWRSGLELIKPIAECVIFAFRSRNDGSTSVDEKPP